MKKIEPNSIELWATLAETEFANNRKPLDENQANALINVFFSEENMEKDNEIAEKLEKNQLGLCSIFYNRVACCHTYKVTKAVALFIGAYIANSPGEVVMYTNFIQYKAFKKNQKLVNMDFICTEIFPMGIPTEQALQNLWELQKVEREDMFDSDNLLDYASGQETITIK